MGILTNANIISDHGRLDFYHYIHILFDENVAVHRTSDLILPMRSNTEHVKPMLFPATPSIFSLSRQPTDLRKADNIVDGVV